MFAGLKRKLSKKKSKKNTSKVKSTKPVVHKSRKSKKGGYRTKKSKPKSKSKKSLRKKKSSKRKKTMRGGAIRYPAEYYGKNSGRYGEDNHKGASFPVPNLTPTI